MNKRKKIEVYEDEYNRFRDDSFFLDCLCKTGIENWEGYDCAVELYANKDVE